MVLRLDSLYIFNYYILIIIITIMIIRKTTLWK